MGAGNVIVLEETLKSFVGSGICNEVIYGDLLLWQHDREIVKSYQDKYNLKFVFFKFDFIFKNGFSAVLNELSERASNDIVVYMNTSEIISVDNGVKDIIKNNEDCNTFYFDHATDKHRWFRCYNRHDLKWSGMIHEELIGDYKPYHKPIFTMGDLEKDLQDPLKAKILNDIKEICYFQQYINLIDFPERQGATNEGWIPFAKDNYGSMKERLLKKGARYEAFKVGDLEKYMNDVMTNPEFKKERFESSNMIEFQGSPMFLDKK